MSETYNQIIKKFRPQFGNKNHVKALELIRDIEKIEGKSKSEDVERKKTQVIILINQK